MGDSSGENRQGSNQAMDLLEQARESTGGEGLVFPAQRGKPLTDSTI